MYGLQAIPLLDHLYNIRANTRLSYWEPCVTCAIDMIRLTDDYMTTPMHLSICIMLYALASNNVHNRLTNEVCAVTEI